jgi:hypothetical protein
MFGSLKFGELFYHQKQAGCDGQGKITIAARLVSSLEIFRPMDDLF